MEEEPVELIEKYKLKNVHSANFQFLAYYGLLLPEPGELVEGSYKSGEKIITRYFKVVRVLDDIIYVEIML